MDKHELPSDAEIEIAFKNTDFGHTNYRELLATSVLKKMVGYHCGHTITTIMKSMRLIGKNGDATKRGKRFVAHEFNHLMIARGG